LWNLKAELLVIANLCIHCALYAILLPKTASLIQHTMTTMIQQQQQQEDVILRDVKEEKRTFLKQSTEKPSATIFHSRQ
jgi:hypothetical protein